MKTKRLFVLLCCVALFLCLTAGCTIEDPDDLAGDTEKVATTDEYIDESYVDENYEEGKLDEEYQKYLNAQNTQVYDPDSGKDQYMTGAIPAGKPSPVEPENQVVDKGTTYTCTLYIECGAILNNMDDFNQDKMDVLPSDGIIYAKKTVTFYKGESVFNVLQRECQKKRIHMEFSWTPGFNSHYIEGIHNLYEFDCGELSGWMYTVNGWYPNYGCSRYLLANGDAIEWRYTCDLGRDLGQNWVE